MNRRRAFWWTFAFASAALMTGLYAYAGKTPPPPRPPVNCKYVLCAYPDCLENEHTEVPAGQCCPVCVPNQ